MPHGCEMSIEERAAPKVRAGKESFGGYITLSSLGENIAPFGLTMNSKFEGVRPVLIGLVVVVRNDSNIGGVYLDIGRDQGFVSEGMVRDRRSRLS